jgi:BlaI family transcriptional regulator, penicillinase repressor
MPNSRPQGALSDAQLEIMNVVWDRGECSVADVWQALQEQRTLARNTVQTTMVRLESRGWLAHRDDDGTFIYRATISRDEAQRQSVQQMLDTVFRGSTEGLVLTLLENQSLSKAEAARIRKMIRQAEERS